VSGQLGGWLSFFVRKVPSKCPSYLAKLLYIASVNWIKFEYNLAEILIEAPISPKRKRAQQPEKV
jgi:hypothetical protein